MSAHGKKEQSVHGQLTFRHMSYHMSQLHVSITVPVYWPRHAPTKIKRGGHFGVLTGMWIFQNVTVHRETNSAK